LIISNLSTKDSLAFVVFLHGYSSFSKELKIVGMNLQNYPNIRVLTSGIRVPGKRQKRPIQNFKN
jgi:hypothetical protein